MSIDLVKLASQGRAFSGVRPWTNEELEALQAIIVGCNVSRLTAADYVRNGIMTPEDVETAQKKGIKTKTVEEMTNEAVEETKKKNAKALGKSSKK